jgi:hypothetical protein
VNTNRNTERKNVAKKGTKTERHKDRKRQRQENKQRDREEDIRKDRPRKETLDTDTVHVFLNKGRIHTKRRNNKNS